MRKMIAKADEDGTMPFGQLRMRITRSEGTVWFKISGTQVDRNPPYTNTEKLLFSGVVGPNSPAELRRIASVAENEIQNMLAQAD